MLLIDKLARSRSLTGTRCLLSGALLIKPGSIFGLPPQAVSQSRSLGLTCQPSCCSWGSWKIFIKNYARISWPGGRWSPWALLRKCFGLVGELHEMLHINLVSLAVIAAICGQA